MATDVFLCGKHERRLLAVRYSFEYIELLQRAGRAKKTMRE